MREQDAVIREALCWLAMPFEDQLRLMGPSVSAPGFELAEMSESAAMSARSLIAQCDPRLSMHDVAILDHRIAKRITEETELESVDAVRTSPFWEEVRREAGSLLASLGYTFKEPDPF